MEFGVNGGFDFTKKIERIVKKKDRVMSQQWICQKKDKKLSQP